VRTPTRWSKAVKHCFGPSASVQDAYFYESKKNQVSLIAVSLANAPPMQVIGKMFSWGERGKEEDVLRKAAALGVEVPAIIGGYRNILFMEYVPGSTLRSLLPSSVDPRALLSFAASWLANFHRVFRKGRRRTLLKGDMRLQNFIMKGGTLYGVDFEESAWGDPLEDVADMAATLLRFPWQSGLEAGQIAEHFVESYGSGGSVERPRLEERLAYHLSERDRIKALL